MRITIACPLAHIEKANQFARCVGLGPDDDKTFGEANWSGPGTTYAVASGIVSDEFATKAFSPLVEPEWGTDMVLAQEAQLLLTEPGFPAGPDNIATAIGDDIQEALSSLGVVRIEEPEDFV